MLRLAVQNRASSDRPTGWNTPRRVGSWRVWGCNANDCQDRVASCRRKRPFARQNRRDPRNALPGLLDRGGQVLAPSTGARIVSGAGATTDEIVALAGVGRCDHRRLRTPIRRSNDRAALLPRHRPLRRRASRRSTSTPRRDAGCGWPGLPTTAPRRSRSTRLPSPWRPFAGCVNADRNLRAGGWGVGRAAARCTFPGAASGRRRLRPHRPPRGRAARRGRVRPGRTRPGGTGRRTGRDRAAARRATRDLRPADAPRASSR